MALVKHSRRTVRRGCHGCGRTDLYWYHDTDRAIGNECTTKTCEGYGSPQSWILMTPSLWHRYNRKSGTCDNVEYDTGNGARITELYEQPQPTPEETVQESEVADLTRPEPPKPSPPGDNRVKALQDALSGLVTASIDEDDVRRIANSAFAENYSTLAAEIHERLDAIAVPTRVMIHDKTTGTEHELPEVCHSILPTVIRVLDRMDLRMGMGIMLVGPAGTGKSTIAKQAAKALGLAYDELPLSPMTPNSEIVGYRNANGDPVTSTLEHIYRVGGVMNFEEVDNSNPAAMVKLNAAIANGEFTFPSGRFARHVNTRFIGTANTFGTGPDRVYVGRQPLDAAFLDRFVVIEVPVDEALEDSLVASQGAGEDGTRMLAFIRHCRAQAATYRLPLIFSPRSSAAATMLLSAGFSWDDSVRMAVRKGISDTDWTKVTTGWS